MCRGARVEPAVSVQDGAESGQFCVKNGGTSAVCQDGQELVRSRTGS